MERWLTRFLDAESEGERQRFCIVADYLRALRVLGAVSPGVQERWRLVCNTADPLVSGSRAASQLRRFVDFVEQEVSIPEGFPHVDFIRDADGGAALEASRHWAENVMAITLDMGSSRIRSVEGAVPTGSGATPEPMVGSAPVESSAGAAVSASEFVEVQEEVRESERLSSSTGLGFSGEQASGRNDLHSEVTHGDSTSPATAPLEVNSVFTRKVVVKTATRELGQCLVHVTEHDDGQAVFSQVSGYLARFSDPPVPKAMFIGDTFEDGEHLDTKDIFVHLFDEHEVPTVLCVDAGAETVSGGASGVGCTPALCLEALRKHHLLAQGDLREWPQRKIIVKSYLRELGSCLVAIPEGATPYTVFSQVSAALGQVHRVPPLPRWMYVGADRRTGMALDLGNALIDQVLDTEQLTVECQEQGFGLTRVTGEGQVDDAQGRRKRRRKRRHVSDGAGGSTGEVTSKGRAGSSRRHGWDVQLEDPRERPLRPIGGWDAQPVDVDGLPEWMASLVADTGISLGPVQENTRRDDGVLKPGSLEGFGNLGRQEIYRFLQGVGHMRRITLHVRLSDGGESIFELDMFNNEVATFLRRLAMELRLSIAAFGSTDVSGWSLQMLDSFEVPEGNVVIAQVVLVRRPPVVARGHLRPRTPSRSPKRRMNDDAKKTEHGRHSGGLPRSRPKFGGGGGNPGGKKQCDGASGGEAQQVATVASLYGGGTGASMGYVGKERSHSEDELLDGHGISLTLPFSIDGGCCDDSELSLKEQVRASLSAEGRHLSDLSERSAELADLHPAFYHLLTKTCGASVCFTKESKVAHFNDDSWVAVHEYYVLDLFPPPGVWFSSFSDVWVCSVFPSVPQDLLKLQEQVRRWGPGTIGTDCRTNVFFQLVRIVTEGLWLGRIESSGTLVYLQVHCDYLSWGSFEIGARYVGFQVSQVGLLHNVPVVAIPGIGSGSSLLQRWHQALLGTSLPVVYELFAGIGGWHAGLQQLGSAQVLFIEISEVKARALATSLNIPCIHPHDLSPLFLERSCVLIADVRDASWYHVSLVAPPQVAVWSSPCVSWSKGGLARGLLSQDGLLFLDAASLVQVFGPPIDVGENVPGLLEHPDWETIFQVHFSQLSKMMPMSRGRIFLSRGLPKCELPVYKVSYPQEAWTLAEDEIQQFCLPTMDEKEMLGEFRFLPASIRRVAASYMTPRDLLALRVVDSGVLPTLVASYRFQCELSVDHLLCKGIYTWMLPSNFGPRFVDAFEAAWIFGFGHKLVLPAFPKAAMHCIGNCVAPVQAAQVWWLVWQRLGFRCLAPSFEALIKAMVLGRPPLASFRRLECCEQWFLGSQSGTCLPAQSDVLVVADGVLQPFRGKVGQRGEILQDDFITTAGNLLAQKTVENVETVLDEVHVTVLARFQPVIVALFKGALRFSPFCSIRSMLQVLTKVCDAFPFQPWNLEQQLHIMRTPLIHLGFRLSEGNFVTVVTRETVHKIQFVEGITVSQLVGLVFPFGLQVLDSRVWSCKAQCWVPVQEEVVQGEVYQLEFATMQVLVEPFGFLRLDPEMRIFEVQDYCSKRFFGNVTAVFLQANGLFLNGNIELYRAAAIGVIRAQVFPLKGGSRPHGDWEAESAEEPDTGSSASPSCSADVIVAGDQVKSARVQVLVEPFGLLWLDPTATVHELLHFCSEKFFGGKVCVTLRINMWQPSPGATIAEICMLGVMRIFVYPLKGGALTVSAAEEMVQNQLVAHGATVSHAKSTADHLVQTVGMTAIKKALDHKDVWGQLKALASKSNVVLIRYLDRPIDPLQEQDPWSGYQQEKGRRRAKPSRKNEEPKEVTVVVDFTFFHAAGAELQQVTIEQLFQGISGLATCSFAEGFKYIREVTGRSLSVKASGLLFTGIPPSDFEIAKHGNAAGLVVPVWLDGKPAALQCVLFQTGDVQVSYHVGKTVKGNSAASATDCTVMIHVYRDEHGEEAWEALESLAVFLRHLGFNATAFLKQIWAVGFYDKNRKCSREKASYCHGFVKVPDTRHLELLKLSGTKGFYCSSRSVERSADPRYRVIWLDGLSHEEAMLQLRATVDHAGLVRAKRGYGIRVSVALYGPLRQKLLPGAAESSGSDEGGDKRFRLLGVPRTTDRSGLKRVLQELGWPAKVVRAHGYQCWVVSSAVMPPHRSFSIEESQVVITAEALQVNPVVGGEKAVRSQTFAVASSSGAGVVALPTPAGTMQAALDDVAHNRFTALEKRLDTIEKNNTKVQEKYELRLTGVESRMTDVTNAVNSMTTVVGDQLKASLDQFSKSVDGRFREMTAVQAETQRKSDEARAQQFQELQDLLAHKSPKVRAVAQGPSEGARP